MYYELVVPVPLGHTDQIQKIGKFGRYFSKYFKKKKSFQNMYLWPMTRILEIGTKKIGAGTKIRWYHHTILSQYSYTLRLL